MSSSALEHGVIDTLHEPVVPGATVEPTAEAAAASTTPGLPTVLAALLALSVFGSAAYLLHALYVEPIRAVRVAGDLRHVSRQALESVVAPYAARGFFRVDVDAVRRAVRQLPWVKTVSVRRAWPASLHIAVIEREPIARWRTRGLIGRDGTLFFPTDAGAFRGLVRLAGPEGSEPQVLAHYREFARVLAPIGSGIRAVHLDARGAWKLQLDDGIELVLGRSPERDHLARFARALHRALASRLDRIERIDLRYANGFAVRWKPAAGTGEQQHTHDPGARPQRG